MSLLFCEKEDLLQSGFLLEYLPCIVSKNGQIIGNALLSGFVSGITQASDTQISRILS